MEKKYEIWICNNMYVRRRINKYQEDRSVIYGFVGNKASNIKVIDIWVTCNSQSHM